MLIFTAIQLASLIPVGIVLKKKHKILSDGTLEKVYISSGYRKCYDCDNDTGSYSKHYCDVCVSKLKRTIKMDTIESPLKSFKHKLIKFSLDSAKFTLSLGILCLVLCLSDVFIRGYHLSDLGCIVGTISNVILYMSLKYSMTTYSELYKKTD